MTSFNDKHRGLHSRPIAMPKIFSEQLTNGSVYDSEVRFQTSNLWYTSAPSHLKLGDARSCQEGAAAFSSLKTSRRQPDRSWSRWQQAAIRLTWPSTAMTRSAAGAPPHMP